MFYVSAAERSAVAGICGSFQHSRSTPAENNCIKLQCLKARAFAIMRDMIPGSTIALLYALSLPARPISTIAAPGEGTKATVTIRMRWERTGEEFNS